MKLIVFLRYLQFYSHIAHNILGGKTFFQDHEFLASLYQAYEAEYDMIVERFIGLDKKLDLVKAHKAASDLLETPENFDEAFNEILQCENEICKACEELSKDASLGLGNLLATLADNSEARQFKLKKRLG